MFWSPTRKIKLQRAWKGCEGYFNLCTPKLLSQIQVSLKAAFSLHFLQDDVVTSSVLPSGLATSVKGKPALSPSGEKLLGASDQIGCHLGTAWDRVPGSWGSM